MSGVSIVRRYFDELFSGRFRPSAAREWLADEFTFHDPLMKADSADDYVAKLRAVADELDLRGELLQVVGEGEEICAIVSFEGPAGPMPYAHWFTLREGKIARLQVFYDPRPFLARQGGSAPDDGEDPLSRGVPSGYTRITPYLNYEDTGAMMEWLSRAFGLAERHATRRADGFVTHAEMTLRGATVMMGSPGGSFRNPKHLGQITQSLYIYIDDLDAHCERAREAGASIIEEPADQPYGDRRYGAADPEGHCWYFASRLEEGGC